MDNKELLQKIKACHEWQSQAILQLNELIEHESKFTQQAISEVKEDILQNIQLNISEMEILSFELEG